MLIKSLLNKEKKEWMKEQIIPIEIVSEIRNKILQEVDMLPSLPESLKKIMEMCNSQNLEFQKLAIEIEKNPALSAELDLVADRLLVQAVHGHVLQRFRRGQLGTRLLQ